MSVDPKAAREPGPPSGVERRSEPRIATNTPARLFYGPGLAHWADCVVKDRSRSGAKIQAPAIYQLPQKLVLLEYQQGFAFEAQLRWRKAELAGLWLEACHDMQTLTDPAFAEVHKAWLALGPAMRPAT